MLFKEPLGGILSIAVGGRLIGACLPPLSSESPKVGTILFIFAPYLQHSIWHTTGLKKYLLNGWMMIE